MLDLDFPIYADWGAPNSGGGGRGGNGGRGSGRGGERGGNTQRGGDGSREQDTNHTNKRKREEGDDSSERPHKSVPSETPNVVTDASMRDEGAVSSGPVGDAGARRVRWSDDSIADSPGGSNASAPPVMERLSEH